jgi:hypothetical protein
MRKNNLAKIVLLLALCCKLQIANAQKKYNAQTDSLVKSFMIENKILLDPVHDIKYEKGKVVSEAKNYYINQRELKISDTSSINLTVFGAYRSHSRDYLLISYHTLKNNEFLFVGQRLFEEDILILKSFFENRTKELPLTIKREVLAAFAKLN